MGREKGLQDYIASLNNDHFHSFLYVAQSLLECDEISLRFHGERRGWILNKSQLSLIFHKEAFDLQAPPKGWNAFLKDADGLEIALLHAPAGEKVLSEQKLLGLRHLFQLTVQELERGHQKELTSQQMADDFQKQQEFSNAVLDNISDGVVACNEKGELTVFNRATRLFHGLDSNPNIPPEEWARHYQLYHEDGVTLLAPEEVPLRRAFQEGSIQDNLLVLKSIDGTVRDLLCYGRALFNNSGKKMGAVLSMRDVTEIRKANAQVQATMGMFETLLEVSPVGIAVYTADGKLKMWNQANERIYGISKKVAENIITEPSADLDPNISKFLNQLEVSRKSKKRATIELKVEIPGKDAKDIQLILTPFLEANNNIRAFLAISIDISEMKKHEANLVASNKALQEASVAKSQFLSVMSHELRTPLNGILGLTEMVLLSALESDQKKNLLLVQSSAHHLRQILEGILNFTQIQSGQIQLENQNFSIQELYEKIYKKVKPLADLKGLQLEKVFAGDPLLVVKGDDTRIGQVLENLLLNAVKFSDQGQISTKIQLIPLNPFQAEIVVEVHDQGIGIDAESLEKIFQRFTQVDSSSKRRFEGIGLGLSTCKGLLDLMQGEIGAISEPGKGSTFWFKLKLEAHRSQLHQNVIPRVLQILLAEDNVVNQKVIKAFLSRLGYAVDISGNGKEALEKLLIKKYDLILMDCQMPEMDGYEATRQIRLSQRYPQTIPIVALTANALAGDRERCLATGMNDYLTKPVQLADLKRITDLLLDKPA